MSLGQIRLVSDVFGAVAGGDFVIGAGYHCGGVGGQKDGGLGNVLQVAASRRAMERLERVPPRLAAVWDPLADWAGLANRLTKPNFFLGASATP